MGYYTSYTFSIYANPDVQLVDPQANEKAAVIINQFVDKELEGMFDDGSDGDHYIWYGTESFKWYDCDDDMKKLSSMLPDVVLKMEGSGEEEGDLWQSYFLNGKHQYCPAKITYDDFDPSKLQ